MFIKMKVSPLQEKGYQTFISTKILEMASTKRKAIVNIK